jgi:epoxyqueuosine reductase
VDFQFWEVSCLCIGGYEALFPMVVSSEISNIVRKAATAAGFELAGIAPATDSKELEYFPRWIAEGRAGEMKYLEARDKHGRLQRASLAHAAPWARSIVVCAINYNTAQPYSTQVSDKSRGWISRYAWSHEDYHESVMRRLRQVETALRDACTAHANPNAALDAEASASANSLDNRTLSGRQNKEQLITRCYVDTGPIVERVVAKYAGIGWTGKNTCLINQKLGSWLFLGVILTSLDLALEVAGLPAPDRCGSCTRCIEACPTDALIGPYQLDSNKCISYLTIEKRGAIADDGLRSGMGRHVFGCDICQDVCPWNRKAPATNAAEFQPRPELVNPELEWLADMSDEEFRLAFRGSPVRRAKRAGLRRNAVIAMGNSGDQKFLALMEKLAQGQNEDKEDEVIRESAAWAARKLRDLS